jgi:hypothetical protein
MPPRWRVKCPDALEKHAGSILRVTELVQWRKKRCNGRKCVGDTERLEGIWPITATSGPAPVHPTAPCAFCSCDWHSSFKPSSINDTLPCYMLLHHKFETIQSSCRWRHYVPINITTYNDCTVWRYKINTSNNTSGSVWPAIIIMSCIQSRSTSESAKTIQRTTTVQTADTITACYRH